MTSRLLASFLVLLTVSAFGADKTKLKKGERSLLGKDLKEWEALEFGGSGEVLMEEGVLVIENGAELSGVKLKDPKTLPTMDYEVVMEARKTYGFDFFSALTFPFGNLETCATLVVGGWGGGVVGISSIDNLDASENATTEFMAFEKDQWYTIRLRVTKNRLQGWVDEKEVFDQDTTGQKIGMRPGQIDMCAPFGLATFQTTGEIRKLVIRDLKKVENPDEPAAQAAGKKPNILMILVDDLGYGDLSSYGAKDLKSPHIDALVEAGMRFDNFYANCCVCSPTRASLLTGRYPDRVGVPGVVRTYPESNWGFMDPAAKLVPDVLEPAGYTTALVGKWHLGLEAPNTPPARGFDHFHGFLADMMDDYYKHQRHGQDYMRLNEQEIHPEGHATDLFSQWAIDYLKARAGEPEKPWFLYLAYNAPHTPIQPPADWLKKVQDREPEMTERRAKLVALIEHMDYGIGQVMAELKALGLDENTLVVFSSDNGGQANVGASNGDNRGEKQDMYEGGIRVATCAVWPGKIEPGSRSEARGLTMDFLPTFAEAAGAPIEHEIDGTSLLPILLGGEVPELATRDTFFVRREGGESLMGECSWAMRRGDWKLVKDRPGKPWEMFNLKEDHLEKTDRWREKRPKELKPMADAMRRHIQASGDIPWQE